MSKFTQVSGLPKEEFQLFQLFHLKQKNPVNSLRPGNREEQIDKTNIDRELNEVASKDSKKLKKKKTNIAHSAKRTQLTLKKTRASN